MLAESGLILSYLLTHFSPPPSSSSPSLLPLQWQEGKEDQVGGETEAWLRYQYYMHYAEGSLMPYLVFALVMRSASLSPLLPLPFPIYPFLLSLFSKTNKLTPPQK